MSPVIDLKLDGDNAWPELRERQDEVLHLRDATLYMAVLPAGMESGKPSVAIRVEWEPGAADGKSVLIAETSVAVLLSAVKAIAARYE